MEAFALLFGVVGAWAWLIMFGYVGLLVASIAYEKARFTGPLLIVVFGLHEYFTGLGGFHFLQEHWWQAIAVAIGYIVAGLLWMRFKWNEFGDDAKEQYFKLSAQFWRRHSLGGEPGTIPANLRKKWREFLESNDFNSRYKAYPPKSRQHKVRLATWGGYWWLSVAWWVCDNPFRRIGNQMYKMVAGTLERDMQKKFEDVSEDFAIPSDEPAPTPPSDDDAADDSGDSGHRRGEVENIHERRRYDGGHGI